MLVLVVAERDNTLATGLEELLVVVAREIELEVLPELDAIGIIVAALVTALRSVVPVVAVVRAVWVF